MVLQVRERTPEQRQSIADGCARSPAFQRALAKKRTPKARARAYADAKCGVKMRDTELWQKVYRARLALYRAEAALSE